MAADLYGKNNKLVATWISVKDFQILEQLAHNNKVTLAAYVRAIIVDAVQEEDSSTQVKPATIQLHQQVV